MIKLKLLDRRTVFCCFNDIQLGPIYSNFVTLNSLLCNKVGLFTHAIRQNLIFIQRYIVHF